MTQDYSLQYDEVGNIINGCLPQDDYALEVYETLNANAVDIATLGAGEKNFDMPVLQYNDALRAMMRCEWEKVQALWDNGGCNFPWEVEKALPANRQKKFSARGTKSRLYWSQGSQPSCMAHADAFAGASGILARIALGDNRVYVPCNPIVTFAISKGGSLRGGQTVSVMSKFANDTGHFPEYLVGENNQSIPADYRKYADNARDHQWSIAFLTGKNASDLAGQIIECCKAGFGVAFGNSTAVRGAGTDSNGIKTASIGGNWSHATGFNSYRKFNGTEYVFWVNSHGAIYGSSNEGEPADGAWMSRKQIETMCQTMFAYGQPYVVIPESIWCPDKSLISDVFVKRPGNFKT